MRENVPEHQIFVTGNTGIDALHWASGLETSRSPTPSVAAVHDSDRADRGRHRASPRELGRRAARRSPRASPARRAPTPRSSFVVPLHPNPLVRERAGRAAPRSRQRAAHRAARVRGLRPPARPLPPGDHRLRRHPGGGALARQAGAGRARDDRADRGHRGRDAVAGRHRPRPDRRRGRAPARRPRAPTGGWPRRRTRTATATPPSGSSRHWSTSARAASRPRVRLGLRAQAPCSPPPDTRAALDPSRVPAHERGPDQDELGAGTDREASELWPS